jgi:predicted Zn-dependent peptidase
MGVTGTNAYTWVDQTVYVNDVPANQLKKWIGIEGERFRNPVMRLFHTELEAVYEEKNRSLDNDNFKTYQALLAGLFQKHTYGTQTTIGTIQHLKNPSLKKIKEYLSNYYVPNNMAVCIAGDIQPDSTIRWINHSMGKWVNKPVNAPVMAIENAIATPVVKTVMGPFPESLMMGFRLAGASSKDADLVSILTKILFNGKAGLIDLDLIQKQKVLSARSETLILNDYSAHLFTGEPKQGQKLEEVKDLLLAEIDKIKKGNFPDWMLTAILNNMKLDQIHKYETNEGRVGDYVDAFINTISWKEYVNHMNSLAKITKEDVIAFANKNYGNNYVLVYKRTGEDTTVEKVEKPAINPVETNRNEQSPYVKNLLNTPSGKIKPVFVDYVKDIQKGMVKKNVPILYTPNKESKTFAMYYIVDMGSNHNKKLPLAIDYLPYLGTSLYTPEQLQQEFYKLACSFGVFNSAEQCYISLSGLSDNFEQATRLFENLLSDAKPNPEALTNFIQDVLKKRSDAKLDKDAILDAQIEYAKYGAKSHFTHVLSDKELNVLKAEELISILKSLTSYEHRILYYGSAPLNEVITSLGGLHKSPEKLSPLPAETKFEELPTPVNKIFAVDYDMAQAKVTLLSKSEMYYKALTPAIQLFNQYFGGNMSSILFQELRESKALAYSVGGMYGEAKRIDKNNYMLAYIGTQADKLPEAMEGLMGLMKSMPESELAFESAQKALLEDIRSTRITKADILFNYEEAKRLGLDHDIRMDVYNQVQSMKLDAVKRFHSEHVSHKQYHIALLGNKKLIDEKVMQQYGTIQWLSLEELFGY